MTDNQNVSDAAGQTTGQVRKVRASHARPATAPRAGQLASSRKPDLTSTLPKLEAVPAPQRQYLFRENHGMLSFSLRQRRFMDQS